MSIQPPSREEVDFLVDLYARSPHPDFEICGVRPVENEAFRDAFLRKMATLSSVASRNPSWTGETDAPWREILGKLLTKLSDPSEDVRCFHKTNLNVFFLQFPNVRCMNVWHGMSDVTADALATASLWPEEERLFMGNGRYFSPDVPFAVAQGFKEDPSSQTMSLMLCCVAFRNVYPVVGGEMQESPSSGDSPKLMMKSAFEHYDAHFAGLAAHPGDKSRFCFQLSAPDRVPDCSAIVLFDLAQVVPRFVVNLRRRSIPLPAALPPNIYAGFF